MDIFFEELLKYGIGGTVAAIFLWQLIQERKEHAITRDKLIQAIDDRRIDQKESTSKVSDVLSGMAIGLKAISDKIEISKGNK